MKIFDTQKTEDLSLITVDRITRNIKPNPSNSDLILALFDHKPQLSIRECCVGYERLYSKRIDMDVLRMVLHRLTKRGLLERKREGYYVKAG